MSASDPKRTFGGLVEVATLACLRFNFVTVRTGI